MVSKILTFLNYLLKKRTELSDLEAKDALLAKTVLDIHRKRTHSATITVPLFSLKQIHAIDRENAIHATNERINTLKQNKDTLLKHQHLTKERLADFLPSVSGIKVVKHTENSYIAYEGNGRLVALQNVFSPADNILIDVEEYYFNNPNKIVKRIERVRQLNGLDN